MRTRLLAAKLCLAVGFASCATPHASACTAFAAKSRSDEPIVGKNFDWLPNRGMIVHNPARLVRHAILSPHESWTSRYQSLSFTPLGPGLPVSSMNEKGLVVEMLLDEDKVLPVSRQNALLSFEWAQYVVDSFENVDAVANFAQSKGFDQILKPIHFFICDIKTRCIVVESAENSLKVTRGKDLPIRALANQAYAHDLSQSEDWLTGLGHGSVYLPYSSATRFWSLVKAVRQSNLNTTDEIFSVLDVSKIHPITQWQIIWKPREKKAVWREPSLLGSATTNTVTIKNEACSAVTKVQYLSEPNKTVEYRPENVTGLYDHLQAISATYGAQISSDLAKRLAAVAFQTRCETSGK